MSSSNLIEEIKQRIDIAELISEYLELKKTGSHFKALCPFHAEKTPSFTVSQERQFFHCFGCGKSGDIFTFLQEMEAIDFKEALKRLADKAGLDISLYQAKSREDKDKLQNLFKIMQDAMDLYKKKLSSNQEAQNYLLSRALNKSVIHEFSLGFAPDSWDFVLKELKNKSYKEEDLELVGLIKKGEKGFYDRFRSRIIFPIFNSSGKVVAFTGRIFGKDDPAKYLNSPETPLFHKSDVLYGFNIAKQYIRKFNFVIITEGQMDTLAFHSAGFKNAIALSGTALSEKQISDISRLTKNVLLALDNDEAGIRASIKNARLLYANSFDLKILPLDEKDPSDILQNDPSGASLRKFVKESQNFFDFIIKKFRQDLKNEEKYVNLLRATLLPILADLPSSVMRDIYAEKLANAILCSKEAVIEDVLHFAKSKSAKAPFGRKVYDKAKQEKNKRKQNSRLYLLLFWLERSGVLCKKLKDLLKVSLLSNLEFESLLEGDLMRFDEEFETRDKNELCEEFAKEAERRLLKSRLKMLKKSLKKSELQGDDKKAVEILNEINELKSKLET